MTALSVVWLVLLMVAGNQLWRLYSRCCPSCGGRTRHEDNCVWRDK